MPRDIVIPEPVPAKALGPVSVSSSTIVRENDDASALAARNLQGSRTEDEYLLRFGRVLNSQELIRSERLRVLLIHLLRGVQEGRPESLTERSIGMDVFGREQNWDPTIDPCVRVAIGRLRTKLTNYYRDFGREDSVKIVLAKGSYAPQLVYMATPVFEESAPTTPDHSDIEALELRGSHPTQRVLTPYTAGSALLLAFLIAAIGWRIWFTVDHSPERFEIVPFATEVGAQFSPAISPDGRKIAYVWDSNHAVFEVYVRPVEGGPPVLMPGGKGGDFYPSWSPDGSKLAFLRTDAWIGNLIVASAVGGEQRVVGSVGIAHGRWTEDSGPLLGDPGPAWSPDGTELIVLDQDHFGIYAISVASGQRRQLTFNTQTTHDFYPRVSPDGQRLAFVRYTSHGISDLFVIPLKGMAEPRQLTHDQRTIRGISWSSDSRVITIASNRRGAFELWNVDQQTSRIEPLSSDTATAADPAASREGQWLAFDNLHEVISVNSIELPSSNRSVSPQPLLRSLGRDRWAARSLDGNKLAFVSDRSGAWQIWLASADGGSPRQVTHLQGSILGGITWSSDNRHLAFDARPSGHSALYLLDTATGVSTVFPSSGSAEERLPCFSPDGKQLYFSSDRNGSVALYRMALTSHEVSLVAPDGFRAQPSQDGRWIYYATMYHALWRVPADGGTPTLLPASLQAYSSSSWTVVGNMLIVLKRGSTSETVNLIQANESLTPELLGSISLPPQSEVLSVRSSGLGREMLLDLQEQLTSDIVLRKRLGSK